LAVSPDGHWVVAGSPTPGEDGGAITAFALDGGEAVPVCRNLCFLTWNTTGTLLYIDFPSLHETSYALPVAHDTGLPKLPPSGIARVEELTNAKPAVIPQAVESAISPSVYAYTQRNIRRNLYRIPLP